MDFHHGIHIYGNLVRDLSNFINIFGYKVTYPVIFLILILYIGFKNEVINCSETNAVNSEYLLGLNCKMEMSGA